MTLAVFGIESYNLLAILSHTHVNQQRMGQPRKSQKEMLSKYPLGIPWPNPGVTPLEEIPGNDTINSSPNGFV
jgi:hypothetical protein